MLLALVLSSSAYAVNTTTIYGSTYQVDTLQYSKVGPGTYFTSIKFTGLETGMTFRTFFIHADVDNPNLTCEVNLGRDSIIGGETVRSVATRKTEPGRYHIAGINGDFFATSGEVGTPTHACVSNGQIATAISYSAPHFVISDKMTPWCECSTFPTVSMSVNGGAAIGINKINGKRYTNELTLINDKMGKYTHTSAGGMEIALELAEGETWGINKTVKMKVVGESNANGNMAIPANGAVLSAAGTTVATVEALKAGDVVDITINQQLNNTGVAYSPNITQMVGGNVYLVADGAVVSQGDMARHPRTMMGYTKDKKQIIFCVFDGRATTSAGGIYYELADIMIYAGAHWAINIDGGGSSTMYVQNLGIMNSPSDGKERAVSNGSYLVLNTPEDNVIAEVKFKDWAMTFPKHGTYRPVFYGYNQYGMLIDTDVKGVTLSCDTELGVINGTQFIGSGSGCHALNAEYNGLKASIPVTIIESDDIHMRNATIINDGFKEYEVEVEVAMGETMMPIAASALDWSCDDPSIVEVNSATGTIKGLKNGTTTVRGTLDDFNGAMEVTVELPTANAMPIDPDMDVTTWIVAQVGGKDREVTAYENGMKINYNGASGRACYLRLSKNINLWSLPDALRLRMNPGDAPITSITLSMMTASGEGLVHVLDAPKANEMNVIDIPMADILANVDDISNYPITLNKIQFGMGTAKTGAAYSIEIPGLECVYNAIPASVEDNLIAEKSFVITPNPINAGDDIKVELSVDAEGEILIYNAAGVKMVSKAIAAGDMEVVIASEGLSSGVYMVSVNQDGATSSAKLLVK